MNQAMHVEILTIGDELLDGRVLDSNTVRLAHALRRYGWTLQRRTSVLDDEVAIVAEARTIASRGCRLCVVSGGLGPTSDDLTAAAFARLGDVALIRDAQAVQAIEKRLKVRGRLLTANQLQQADRPKGSHLLTNDFGTAPGFCLSHEACCFLCLPGVPEEFDGMLSAFLEQDPLGLGFKQQLLAQRKFYTFGLLEAEVDDKLKDLRLSHPEVRFAFQVKFPEIHVVLGLQNATGDRSPSSNRELLLEGVYQKALRLLQPAVYSTTDANFAKVVLEHSKRLHLTLACAESLTGGALGDLITAVPGCSAFFLGSAVTYDAQAKQNILGVKASVLQEHGVVSEACVTAMALGAQKLFGSSHALATTGLAGPGIDADSEKRGLLAGTVWLALVDAQQKVRCRRLQLPYDRRANKMIATYSALDLLRCYQIEIFGA